MAVKDKLVTLEGLKAVHDHVAGDISSLRSAIVERDTQNEDWLNKFVNLTGNIFPYYVKRVENAYINSLNGKLAYSESNSYVSFIFAVKKNTTYSLTNARYLQLLDIDRETLIGERQQRVTTFSSGNAYYVAFSFAPGDYPESSFIFGIAPSKSQLSSKNAAIEVPTFKLSDSQQKYLTTNLYQSGWELGDIGASNGENADSSTTLRTKTYCPVFGNEAYNIECSKNISQLGFVYQYSASKEYLGQSTLITMENGVDFTTDQSCRFIRVVLRSAYGTTFDNDVFIYQNGGLVRNILNSEASVMFKIPTIIVDKNGNGNYETLTDAVNNATDGDIIFVRKGVYNGEKVEAWSKNITIIGESPYDTIIMNELDDYSNPPIEMSVGALYNIQFYSKGNVTTRHAYALHIDNDNQLNGTFYAENVIFKTDYGSGAVGAGMRRNCIQTYRNCVFENSNGPAFFGNETTQAQAGGIENSQYYKFYNCTFKNNVSSSVVIMRGMKSNGSTVYCTFVGCSFMDDGTTQHPAFRMDYTSPEYMGTSDVMGDMGIINWNLDSISTGNTIPDLNAAKDGEMYIVTGD